MKAFSELGRFLTTMDAKAATSLRFDVIFLTPGRWPRHIRDAFGG